MTRSGDDYISSLQDGRQVFIDGELVEDVTCHPAFRGSVKTIAALYDLANSEENRERMTFRSPATDKPVNRAYHIPRTSADLAARREAMTLWAEATAGYMGRTPDHVASFLAAFAGSPAVFARGGNEYADNVQAFHAYARDEDQYVTYTIVPPQIDRSKPAHEQSDPHLYAGVSGVVPEGLVITGAQMLGTGTAISNWVLLSCIHPLREGEENQAISCAIRVNAPGVRIYSRKSYARSASSTFDYPLSKRFDETDSLMVFDDVLVPWDHVFIDRDRQITHAQFFETAAHTLGNHQAQVRFAVKLRFIAALVKRVAEMNGTATLPPVQSALGEIAGLSTLVEGLVLAQEATCIIDDFGVARPGAAPHYANMMYQSKIYPQILERVRELCGGGLIQLPSSVSDYKNAAIAKDIRKYVTSPGYESEERVKLLKLVWDAVGSEFASRHLQYEMFYAGAPFVIRGHMFRNFDYKPGMKIVDAIMQSYGLDESQE